MLKISLSTPSLFSILALILTRLWKYSQMNVRHHHEEGPFHVLINYYISVIRML